MSAPSLRALGARWALPRVEAQEWLDQGRGSPAEVAANLAEMGRINRWLGGRRAITRHLYPRLQARWQAAVGTPSVLDLGTGAADLPVTLARWARRQGAALRVLALDCSARSLAVAQQHLRQSSAPAVSLIHADAASPPLAHSSVDFVVASLLLHHFPPPAAVRLLQGAAALAGQSLIVSDLVRGHLPLLAFRLVQPLFARQALTRHDGALSIRRAYTPAELRALARQAGLAGARVHTHFPWRMTLVWDRPRAGAPPFPEQADA